MHSRKSALVIEHDFLLATYLADRVVVFSGKPAIEANASPPQSLLSGMNDFLKSLEVTYRRDPDNYRPRVNKFDSVKDREQKAEGRYVCMQSSTRIMRFTDLFTSSSSWKSRSPPWPTSDRLAMLWVRDVCRLEIAIHLLAARPGRASVSRALLWPLLQIEQCKYR